MTLAQQIEGFRYDLSSEDAVQRGLARVLDGLGLSAEREVQVDCGRLDFLTEDGKAQIDGVRDPDGALVEKLETGADRIKRLAEQYLKGRAA